MMGPTGGRAGAIWPRPTSRAFTVKLTGALPAVWQALADTARFNAAAALPKQTVTEATGPNGEISFTVRSRFGRLPLEWEDLPCNWVREHWFEHRRRFRNGPLVTLDARLDLTPAAVGCLGHYQIKAVPRGVLGRIVLAGGFLRAAERMFLRLAQQADRFARGEQAVPFVPPTAPVVGPARARLDTLARQLEAGPYGHGLAQRLAIEIAEGLEVDVERLRPLQLARRWGVPERHAVEACLEATRLGMLELRWEMLCPRCRGAKASSGTLDQLPTGAHCASCNIDYGRDFSRNVELTLRPVEVIRPIEARRVLPARPDEHTAYMGPRHPRSGRAARHRADVGAWTLSPANPGDRTAMRHRARGRPFSDCGRVDGRGRQRPAFACRHDPVEERL